MGGRRARVLVLDEDRGIQARLVDVVAQVFLVQPGLRLVEDKRSDVVAAAAQVLPAPGFRLRVEELREFGELALAEVGREGPPVQPLGRTGQRVVVRGSFQSGYLAYFSNPKADRLLFKAVRKFRPKSIVELGCGEWSTHQAIA